MPKSVRESMRMILWKSEGLPTGYKLDDIDEEIIDQALKDLADIFEAEKKHPEMSDMTNYDSVLHREYGWDAGIDHLKGMLK